MSREALVLLVCCCDFRDGAERLISSKSLRNAVIRAFPGLFRILRMCAPRRAAAVVRPRGREKSADRRRRILISRLLIIRASVPRRKSPFPAYFKGFPAVSPLIPPYPAFLKYPVSPQKAGTHSPFREESHTTAHTAKQGPSGRGRYHYPRHVLHVYEHPRAGCQNGVLCRFGILAGRCSRRTQKAFGTAMRLCVSLSRGVAAPLGCVIQ